MQTIIKFDVHELIRETRNVAYSFTVYLPVTGAADGCAPDRVELHMGGFTDYEDALETAKDYLHTVYYFYDPDMYDCPTAKVWVDNTAAHEHLQIDSTLDEDDCDSSDPYSGNKQVVDVVLQFLSKAHAKYPFYKDATDDTNE